MGRVEKFELELSPPSDRDPEGRFKISKREDLRRLRSWRDLYDHLLPSGLLAVKETTGIYVSRLIAAMREENVASSRREDANRYEVAHIDHVSLNDHSWNLKVMTNADHQVFDSEPSDDGWLDYLMERTVPKEFAAWLDCQ